MMKALKVWKQNLEFSKEKLKTQIELSVRFSVIPGDPL